MGEMHWQVNATGVTGLSQITINDGMASDGVVAVNLTTVNPPSSGKSSFNGSFSDAELNPAVASTTDELAGHICMGK